jgi:hypothetical protein
MAGPFGRYRSTGMLYNNSLPHVRSVFNLGYSYLSFRFFHHQVVQEISRIYNSIDDVDLFIGGVSERPVEGALLGPTFLCLIGDQFARLRRGDRLFYEEATAKFTPRESLIQN